MNDHNNITAPPHPIRRRIIVCALVLVLGLVLAGLLYTLKPTPQKRPESSLVRTLKAIPVKLGDVKLKISGYGTVDPHDEILLSAQSRGVILSKHPGMHTGLIVAKGELLAQIDSADAKIALAAAIAEIDRLQNELKINEQTILDMQNEISSEEKILELEKSKYERQKKLFDKNIASQSDLEDADKAITVQMRKVVLLKGKLRRLQLTSATIKAQSAEASTRKAQVALDLSRCTIRSPIRGRIKADYVTTGDYVQPGKKLFSIADDSTLEITVTLSAYDIIKTMRISRADVKLYKNWFRKPNAETPIKITWTESASACSWIGKITRICDFDKVTRTLAVTVVPIKPTSASTNQFPLVDGMFCKITFTGRTLQNAMLIPWSALQLDGDAFTIDKNHILHQRKIDIYSMHDDKVIVTGGLPEGEMLVTQRLPRGIINGSKVNIAYNQQQSQKTKK